MVLSGEFNLNESINLSMLTNVFGFVLVFLHKQMIVGVGYML